MMLHRFGNQPNMKYPCRFFFNKVKTKQNKLTKTNCALSFMVVKAYVENLWKFVD